MKVPGNIVSCLLAVILIGASVEGRPHLPRNNDNGANGPERVPLPSTVDQIIHNAGNIVTTVDNWGYIGGYEYYNKPSGEWPRNSGRSYIGELFYWMGATLPNGDTVVADAYEDFQSIPSLISGTSQNKILLSTDTSRYHDFDVTDTTGLGRGNPARGWREWDGDSSNWVYSNNYNPTDSSFAPGGPLAVQVSHYRFNDAASGASVLGLEMTQTILQWNYCYNEDFLFVVLEITNRSANDYNDFAFAVYSDIDVGGPDGTGENGRLEDLVGYDTSENLAWTYDSKGRDPGWGMNVRTGYMGTKYLETPDSIGMTSFRNEDWALVPDEDPARYAFITSTQFDAPRPPTDQLYLQCTRGIQLVAGKTVRVVYALIAGQDEQEFRDNAALAQELYDNYFVGPQPPTTPKLRVEAGDRKVYLHWDDTSEVGIDPLSGENDFAGYKLYRSDNQGRTWGEEIEDTDNNCLDLDYETIAEWRVDQPGDPVVRNYIDTGLYNGVEYWYCLVAIDTGASATGIDPLQSGFGVAGEAPNVIKATPRNNPAGFYDEAATVQHIYTGPDQASEGNVIPVIFDHNALQGTQYRVVFQDTDSDTYWHLINETTGDTVLQDQTEAAGEDGLSPVAEGLRIVVTNGDRVPQLLSQTGFTGTDTSLVLGDFFGPAIPALTGDNNDIWGDKPFRSTYELRFTSDSTIGRSLIDYWVPGGDYTIPFEIWNTTTNQRVSMALYDGNDNGVWDIHDYICIVDFPYNPAGNVTQDAFPVHYGWLFGFDSASYNPMVGDVFTVAGAPLNGPNDVFTFRIDGIDANAASAAMKNIKVVPNPYFVHYAADPAVEIYEGMPVLEFQKVPNECTIRIYTVGGDLVRTLTNTAGQGTVRWDLYSHERRQVASGMYIYHVDSPYGTHIGRFAVIK